jgi:hypothetical protein
LLPAVVLGFFVAGRLVGKVDKAKTRAVTLGLCSVSALVLTVQSLMTLLATN